MQLLPTALLCLCYSTTQSIAMHSTRHVTCGLTSYICGLAAVLLHESIIDTDETGLDPINIDYMLGQIAKCGVRQDKKA